jgi:hypothetical protein
MTSTVTHATITTILSAGYDAISTTVGLAVVLALLALLFQKEIAGILLGQRVSAWLRTFDVALVPFLLVFVVIVSARLWELLQ